MARGAASRLTAHANLANLLDEEGTPESVAEAKRLYYEVVAGKTEHYGPAHVQTLRTKGNLAILLKNEGTPESVAEAKRLYYEVVTGFERDLGPEHPHTRMMQGNLSELEASQ